MKIMHLHRLLRGLAVLLSIAVMAGCVIPPPHPATVYIVRHAEKGEGDDPALTAEGEARAEALARQVVLADNVYSTDTLRTRSTAAPVARQSGVPVQVYDYREPEKLAARVREHGGTTVIVGHSNTIAGLAEAFGGDPGEAVAEDEYDRLYVIRLEDPASSTIRRYGD